MNFVDMFDSVDFHDGLFIGLSLLFIDGGICIGFQFELY